MNALERRYKKKEKDLYDVVFKDCVKDEMRNAEKVQKPRCFAAGPLHYTLLIRRWLGRLQSLLMRNRLDHGICIGINATSREWQKLWNRIKVRGNAFDIDYPNWDENMRKEQQEVLNEVLACRLS